MTNPPLTELNGTCPRLISVILPVYNGAAYLREAIESVLSQTFESFELIVINDGSKDESASIIEAYDDPRIRYLYQENRGLAATLNRAIELSRGEFIARQDQDDVSLPERLEKQVAFLRAHPECGMVGSWAEIWEGKTRTQRMHRHPAESAALKFELLFDNPFVHSSMLIRKEVFDRVGLYATDKSRQPPEDYELWSRVARSFQVANIPEPLLIYREMPGSMSRVAENPFLERVVDFSIENLTWLLGETGSRRDISDLAALAHYARHRLSAAPDFAKIDALLQEAARKTAGSGEGRVDFAPLRRIIRRRYLKHRYGRIAGTLLALFSH